MNGGRWRFGVTTNRSNFLSGARSIHPDEMIATSCRNDGPNSSTSDRERPTVERAGLLLRCVAHFQRPSAGSQFAVERAQALEWPKGPRKRSRGRRDGRRGFIIENGVAQILSADAGSTEELNHRPIRAAQKDLQVG